MKDPSQVRVTGPLGRYAEGFCAELARQGYASSSAVNQLKLVGHLSRWMTMGGLSVPELVPAEIERYVAARRARHRRASGCWRTTPATSSPSGAWRLARSATTCASLACSSLRSRT